MVIDQSPSPSAVTVPTTPLRLEERVTVVEGSAVPVSVGVVSEVMSSSSAVPESLKPARSGADGATGAAVSTVMVKTAEETPVLPAASVAVDVRS